MKLFLNFMVFILWIFHANAYTKEKYNVKHCSVPELLVYQEEYNKRVCQSISAINQKHYKEAIVQLEKTIKIDLFEMPNFYLFPRLALAYSYIGNKEKALENLEKAELTLQIYSRIMMCIDDNGKFKIVKHSWGEYYKVNSKYHDEIAGIMCGDAYDYIYHSENLAVNIREAELVENYLSIKKKAEALFFPNTNQ